MREILAIGRSVARRCLPGAVGVWLSLASVIAGQPALAAWPNVHAATRKCLRWQIVETANFRVLSYSADPVSRQVADECERMRTELVAKWLGADAAAEPWTPKCDIVLHPDDRSYLREVGLGAGSTLASSLIDQQPGKATTRRIDIRGSVASWQVDALPHELTHVVLADRFSTQSLPRWIDEGIAILADPASKQAGHQRDLDEAVRARSAFRVVELMDLRQYPAADRWGAFYGQSASIVRFLVQRRSADEFVNFVTLAIDSGYERALSDVYDIASVAELERQWRAHVSQSRDRYVKARPAGPQLAANVRPRVAAQATGFELVEPR